MSSTVPACTSIELGTATATAAFGAYQEWIEDNPGSFTVVASTATGLLLEHSEGWQLNYRLSSGNLLGMIAPDGGITNPDTPGTPTGAQDETILLPATITAAGRLAIARYDDAIFVGVVNAVGNAFPFAFHHGRIYLPLDASDADLGIDGFGVLASIPSPTNGGGMGFWMSYEINPATRYSRIRSGPTGWGAPLMLRANYNTEPSSLTAKRFEPIAIVARATAAATPSASPPIVGALKYVRGDAGAQLIPLSVVPSLVTDQAWMSVSHENFSTRMRVLWNKQVTP